jgi:hypothetical protein
MSAPGPIRQQMTLDWEYDDRLVTLAAEFGIMMSPLFASGTTSEQAKALAARMALLAGKRLDKFAEPPEMIRCHSCDALVGPKERARVVVCVRCGLGGASPGSDG